MSTKPRIQKSQGRSVAEWVGRTPDSAVPPRVRLRIWEREHGVCHISGRKIGPGERWELDHKVSLVNGGAHAETNLFPALRDKHKEKTKDDLAEKSKVAAIAKKHIGATQPKGMIKSRGFPAKEPKTIKQGLPPRMLFKDVKL